MVKRPFSKEVSPSDELYRIVRDEQRGAEYKPNIEKLWITYQPFADKDFPEQIAQDFHAWTALN